MGLFVCCELNGKSYYKINDCLHRVLYQIVFILMPHESLCIFKL